MFHLHLLLRHLRDPQIAAQLNNSSHRRNCGKQTSQGLRTCRHCQRFPMMIRMQSVRLMIGWTWAVLKENCQSAWSKLNCPYCNLPKGLGGPTAVCSLNERKYGSLGFGRRSIGLLSRGRTVWNSFKMVHGTGRQWLPNFGDIRVLAANW